MINLYEIQTNNYLKDEDYLNPKNIPLIYFNYNFTKTEYILKSK